MIKFTQLFIAICTAFLLLGCEKPVENKSQEELIAEYKTLNNLLQPLKQQTSAPVWPFSDDYLTSRDNILKQLLRADKSNTEVALLTIEQRFTERFFPWPYNANPVLNYVNSNSQINDVALAEFITFTQGKMLSAYQDKVRLSHFELTRLQQHVAQAKNKLADYPHSVDALNTFNQYLADYVPRRSPGIGALPNGKDWYQARLNYFVVSAQKPNDILNRLLAIKTDLPSETKFITCYTTNQCNNTSGLDWRTAYSNRLEEFNNIKFGIEQAIIAEVDYGIHAQAWSSEHALTVLLNELKISNAQANLILKRILEEPALAMVNIPLGN
ncbi:hypothetical protein AAEU29_00895 [Pseudoalteromonas sp. SSM20]|uniref:hypothetical protein n=1 Tax=Pseudoalteromonas sp. SSM20 TaxID=3139394 RepID=UPI003BA8C0D5